MSGFTASASNTFVVTLAVQCCLQHRQWIWSPLLWCLWYPKLSTFSTFPPRSPFILRASIRGKPLRGSGFKNTHTLMRELQLREPAWDIILWMRDPTRPGHRVYNAEVNRIRRQIQGGGDRPLPAFNTNFMRRFDNFRWDYILLKNKRIILFRTFSNQIYNQKKWTV